MCCICWDYLYKESFGIKSATKVDLSFKQGNKSLRRINLMEKYLCLYSIDF